MATAYYLELVTMMTNVPCDQEHIHILVDSCPQTPDRTQFILGLSDEDPVPVMSANGRRLVSAGAEVLAIPCITAHYFHDRLEEEIGAGVLHLIRETVRHLKDNGVRRVGIMGTDGTVRSELFQTELEQYGMIPVVPDPEMQKKVMYLIYDEVKANKPLSLNILREIEKHLRDGGAEVIVLGCTELSMAKKDYDIGPGFIDGMEVLAKAAVEACGAPLKREYQCLITK